MSGHKRSGFTMARKYLEYVEMVGQGEVLSRSDFITRSGKHYSTVRYHLDMAVKQGMLHCQIGYVSDDKVGWLYALPETMPHLPFVEYQVINEIPVESDLDFQF